MNDERNKDDCLRFRRLFEDIEGGKLLSAGEQGILNLHADNCSSCSNWRHQHLEIAELSKSMPQFDVSEGLTQKILDSIEKQSTPGVETSLVPVGLVALIAFFVMVPFDSLQSLYGWGVGLLGLVVLQFLIKTANTREQVV